MDFKYNDYIILISKNKIGKFMCFRPDKNKAIIEVENRISQYDSHVLKKAKKTEVIAYFNSNIKKANVAIDEAQDIIKDNKLKLARAKAKLHEHRLEMNKLEDQILKLSTALQLLGEDNFDHVMAKKLENLGLMESELSKNINSYNWTIERLEENINLANNNKKEWTNAKDIYKEEKRNYLEAWSYYD